MADGQSCFAGMLSTQALVHQQVVGGRGSMWGGGPFNVGLYNLQQMVEFRESLLFFLLAFF